MAEVECALDRSFNEEENANDDVRVFWEESNKMKVTMIDTKERLRTLSEGFALLQERIQNHMKSKEWSY